jgi:PAS domain S-box-containing protein
MAGLISGLAAIMGAFVVAQLRRRSVAEATLRVSEARYRLLADNSTDMVFQLDLDFVRRYVSPASREILGYSADELIGTKPGDQIHPEDADHVGATYRALANGLERASITNRIRHRDGRWIWVEAECRLVRDKDTGIPSAILGSLRDVSARKSIEAEANAARKQAEQAAAAQGQFLATMSHELRTPLNSVLGFADIILDRNDLIPEVRRQVGLIQTAGDFLLTVVNDVLDFSKIEEGKMELVTAAFSLQGLVDNSISVIRDFAAKKNLELTVRADQNIPAYVLGDESRLRQVLLNLLNNAIKFTRSGHVALAVEHQASSPNGEQLRFAISDTGIGIPDDQRNRLFQRFSQVDGSTSREFGGSGLGLAICKRLIELMGGQIGVESKVGEGSTFWFTLTLLATTPSSAVGLSSPTRAGCKGRARILLVEDIDVNQEIARAMLESAGHQVDVVSDGCEAIAAVQAHGYDVVLMDIQMPVMDGVTATKRIRALGGDTGSLPIVAMTANVLPQQVESFRAAGMNGHVAKPVRRNELLAAIERWIPVTAEPEPRAGADTSNAVLDEETFAEVTALLGREKVDGLLARLGAQLEAQFPIDPETAEEWVVLAREAHKLISTAGMFGFLALSEGCARLEAAALGDQDKAAVLLDDVRAACRSALAEIAIRAARPDDIAKRA